MDWVLSLVKSGRYPVMEFVCSYPGDRKDLRIERQIIAHYARRHSDLLNSSCGEVLDPSCEGLTEHTLTARGR